MNDAALRIRRGFPLLSEDSFRITSSTDAGYNCIAWAVADTKRWWWPSDDAYWPVPVDGRCLDDFRRAFRELGFEECRNKASEPGSHKIAFFSRSDGNVTHAARLLPNGRWTSKLGKEEDIEHVLAELEGDLYGQVCCIMRRSVTS